MLETTIIAREVYEFDQKMNSGKRKELIGGKSEKVTLFEGWRCCRQIQLLSAKRRRAPTQTSLSYNERRRTLLHCFNLLKCPWLQICVQFGPHWLVFDWLGPNSLLSCSISFWISGWVFGGNWQVYNHSALSHQLKIKCYQALLFNYWGSNI